MLVGVVDLVDDEEVERKVIAPRYVTVSEPPPNKGMELTVKSVTPFARRRAKGAPLSPAAHPGR